MSYNGWTNHAIWLVNLWTDGDNEIARISSDIELSMYDRTQALKEYVLEMYIEPFMQSSTSLASDLLQSSLSDINWKELVEHYEDCEVEEYKDES